MMRLIICGSRNFQNYELLKERCDFFLSRVNVEIEIVQGEARGADSLAKKYAEEKNYKLTGFPAKWEEIDGISEWRIRKRTDGKFYDRLAGEIRNQQMAEYALKAPKFGCVAFPIGKSKGTYNMIRICEINHIPVRVCL